MNPSYLLRGKRRINAINLTATRPQMPIFFGFLAVGLLGMFSACEKSGEVQSSTPTASPAVASSPSAKSSAPLSLDEIVKFGAAGGSERIREKGWSGTEQNFTWTEGKSATLRISLSASDRPLTMRMQLSALTQPPGIPFQLVEVLVNGQKIADWQVAAKADYTATIPKELVTLGGNLLIELRIPEAFSPKSAGMSSDPRVLGVACREFSISAAD